MSEFGVRVSQGKKRNYEAFRKFGYNPVIGSVEEYIGTSEGPWHPTVAMPIEVSGSNEDAPGGSGAQEVMVQGLNEGFNEVEELVATNGQTPVPTVQSFLRFNRGYVTEGNNVGKILFKADGEVIADITQRIGQTQISGYTVPAGKVLLVTEVHSVVASSKVVDLIFWQGPPKRLVQQYNGLTDTASFTYDPPIKFTPRTDLWFTGKVADTATASIEYTGYLARA